MDKHIKAIYILHGATKHEGANKSFLCMLDGLKEKGIVPYVILPEYGNISIPLEKMGISYAIVHCRLAIYPLTRSVKDLIFYVLRIIRLLIRNRKANNQLYDIALKFKPDLIHTNVGPLHNGHTIAKKLRIPHVWHIREYQDLDFNMSPLFSMKGFIRKLHFKNNFPVAISRGIYHHFKLDGKARVISNGIFKAGCTQFIEKKQSYFLFAGRLEINKGIDKLLRAFYEFSKIDNELMLYVAGDTTELDFKELLVASVNKNAMQHRVKFLGMRDDIADLMANATALIVPSPYEGFGRITVEAMFNGCLVIGNNSGGTKEILEEEQLGILYSGQDELVAAMLAVARNGIASYFELIKKAQARAVTLYSQEQNVEAIYNYYRDILDLPN